MNDVARQLELIVLGLDGVSIDGHVLASCGLEPNDLGVARAAARDAALVGFGRVGFESHSALHAVCGQLRTEAPKCLPIEEADINAL
jgi:hypothetical protein